MADLKEENSWKRNATWNEQERPMLESFFAANSTHAICILHPDYACL